MGSVILGFILGAYWMSSVWQFLLGVIIGAAVTLGAQFSYRKVQQRRSLKAVSIINTNDTMELGSSKDNAA